MFKVLSLILLSSFLLHAELLISPQEALRSTFTDSTKIIKKNILLKNSEAKYVQKMAKLKLDSKIIRYFRAYKDEEVIAYGILLPRKIRSKNGVALYMFTPDKVLKSVEIIAFNEPHEYIPKPVWLKQFEGLHDPKTIRLSKSVANISGATLSARSVTDAARLSRAIMDIIVK